MTVVEKKINVELYSTTQEIYQPPLNNIRSEKLKFDRVDSVQVEPLRKPLNKASVKKPLALNLAREDAEQMQLEEQPYVTIVTRRDEEQQVQQVAHVDELRARAEENRVSVLNAPMLVNEHIPGIETLPARISRPPAIAHQIEEFITQDDIKSQQLSSSVVIPLENLEKLPNDRPNEQRAALINEFVFSKNLNLYFLANNIVQIFIFLYRLSQLTKLDSKLKPQTLNSAMLLVENEQLLPPPTQFQTSRPLANSDRVESSTIALQVVLHEPAHVLVPVDIKSAQSIECEEQQLVELELKNEHKYRKTTLTLKQEDNFEMARASVSRPRDIAVPVLKDLPSEKTQVFEVENVESLKLKETQQGRFLIIYKIR